MSRIASEMNPALIAGHTARTRKLPILWPWVVALTAASVVLGGGYYAYQRDRTLRGELEAVQAQVAGANANAGSAEERALTADAALATARAEADRQKGLAATKSTEAEDLSAKLTTLVGKQGEITRSGDEVSLQLVDKVLFRSGEAALTERGMKVLGEVGAALNQFPDKQIWVQGHTDDVPINGEKLPFASNWELSAARALTVVHYLQTEASVDPKRLAAVAFGEHRPVARKNKAKNRRIEIVLYPEKMTVIRD